MADPVGVPAGPPADEEIAPAGAGELEALRDLIVAPERERLAEIEDRLDDPRRRAHELAGVLPESLVAAARSGRRIEEALAPVVEETLHVSIRRDPRRVAEAIAPAMGPAIRRAIADALRSMVRSLNQVLEQSLSVRGLRWRLEAWRSGRPFAEVALSHSLVYRVEQVFLVHRASGLLLLHVAHDETAAHDGDLVSGMLTAIQDFVRDSFAVSQAEAVDMLEVGDLSVWVEQGPVAYAAAVIRGQAPAELRERLREALELVHLELADDLDSFSGETAPFERARPYLEACLVAQLSAARRGRRPLGPLLAGAGAALAIAAAAFLWLRAGARWSAYLGRLRAEPGIVVVSASRGPTRMAVTGLRDPLAADPASLLAGYHLDGARVSGRWLPYLSADPALVLRRGRDLLRPPASVTLEVAGGVLRATGSAPHAWLGDARRLAALVPGVQSADLGRVADSGLAALAPARAALEAMLVRFDTGATEPARGEAAPLDRLAAAAGALAEVASAQGLRAEVEAVGHTDGTGSEGTNIRLSRARAEWVVSFLQAHGLRAVTLTATGAGTSQPLRQEDTPDGRAANRSVSFRVSVE